MNIAHFLSQNQLTGAEVYACHLISAQIRDHHQVIQISNDFYYPSLAKKIKLQVEASSIFTFWINVFRIRKILKSNNIHVIHSHSRAAAKIAYWSTLGTKIAHVSTIHGRQHLSLSKRIFNYYGQYQIPVCENIQNQLVNEFNYPQRKIKILRNVLDTDRFNLIKNNTATSNKALKIAIIGRLSGPKKERTLNFINALAQNKKAVFDQCFIEIVGSQKIDIDLPHAQFNLNISFTEHADLNSEFYSKFDLIVGSGRVCIEALLSGVPCIAFGEAMYLGLVRLRNYHSFLNSNFGDVSVNSFGSPDVKIAVLEQDFNELKDLSTDELESLSQLANNDFSLKNIHLKILKLYEMAHLYKIHPCWIPILMYHKIPDKELISEHKIFVTKNRFEKHLRFFKMLGFKTLTFTDIQEFAQGLRNSSEFPRKPLVLTFDDGYVDNLNNAQPLLEKYQFSAQIFLLSDSTITHNYWDEPEINKADKLVSGLSRQQWKNSRFTVGSHGQRHDKLPNMTDAKALDELIQSKNNLMSEFNQPINAFAFTYGDIDNRSAELAEKAGYYFAVNTDQGGLLISDNPYAIFRVNIFPKESYLSLWKKTSNWYRKYYFNKRHK